MKEVPEYIERRIRRPVPVDSYVVAGSTPVVSFGDAQTATTATLGLNPSRNEFLDRRRCELVGPSRRLATLRWLGTSGLSNAPQEAIARVLDDCNTYFRRNPLRQWFDQLERILKAIGASYYDGSACHLDLVQWATDPTWGDLRPAALRKRLLDADASFLIEQLCNENIRLLLVNGMGVFQRLRRRDNATWDECEPIVELAFQDCRLFTGTIRGRVRVVAWSTNLQSGFGVTSEFRNELAVRVADLVRVASVR